MSDLVAFLRARLDEDERLALAASPGPWHVTSDYGAGIVSSSKEPCGPEVTYHPDGGPSGGTVGEEDAEHIVRHDPARVLREVEAKRRILDAGKAKHQHETTGEYIRFGTWESCSDDCSGNVWYGVVKLLALPYAYHPDYRSEWAVTP